MTLLEIKTQMKSPRRFSSWSWQIRALRRQVLGRRVSGGQGAERTGLAPQLSDIAALGFQRRQADASCPGAVLVPLAGQPAASSGRAEGVENPGEMRQPFGFN